MSNFTNGINTIGQLCPSPSSFKEYPHQNSVWSDVGNSFQQAGNNIRIAIKEINDAKRESKQTLKK